MLPKPCNKTRTSWTMSARTIGLAVIWFGRHPERAWFAQRRIQRSSREKRNRSMSCWFHFYIKTTRKRSNSHLQQGKFEPRRAFQNVRQ